MNQVRPSLGTVWKFSRPHAFLGTAASIFSLWLIAAGDSPFSIQLLIKLVAALFVCLSAAVLIVGINQYFDVAIDKVNKPFLPMAANELSRRQAQWILTLAAVIAWGGMLFFDRYLVATVVVSSVLGFLYSCPPARWKRNPWLAALLIVVVRGPVINLGLYCHFAHQSGTPVSIPGVVWLLCGLSSMVALSIAICKDIPDVAGDRQYGQATFAQIFGQRQVFRFVLVCLAIGFGGAAIAFGFLFSGWLRSLTIMAQLAVLALLFMNARQVDPEVKTSLTAFYMMIWTIFQWEYLAIALVWFVQQRQYF